MIRLLLCLSLICPASLFAQQADGAASWRAMAEGMPSGSDVMVTLRSGQRFRATLVEVRDDAVLLQPRTRVPVPPQPVSYDEIAAMGLRSGSGVGAGKAVAIGAGSGAGVFLGLLLFLFAAYSD